MIEQDVQWFFKLLPLCPELRLLLTMGPIVSANLKSAPRHGFKMIRQGTFWQLWHEQTRKVLVVHDADTAGEKCITCRVVKNIYLHRDQLRQCLGE